MNMDIAMNAVEEGGLEDLHIPRSRSPSPPEVQDELEHFPNNDGAEEANGNEEAENWFQPMSDEQFTAMYHHFRNKQDWNWDWDFKEFKGFSDEKSSLLRKFYGKKSEILHGLYDNSRSKGLDVMFRKVNGRVPLEVNGVKVVLIYNKIYDQITTTANTSHQSSFTTSIEQTTDARSTFD